MTLGISMPKNIFLLILKCKHLTLAISMLIHILPLHTKAKYHHIKYPSVLH
jgi:hypothetical protein